MKKVNKDPFSNGTEYSAFKTYCCYKCIKFSYMRPDGTFTNADDKNMPNKCSIQRDIVTRMACDEPINQRTIDVCYDFTMHGKLCPYMKTERKKYPKKVKNQAELFND